MGKKQTKLNIVSSIKLALFENITLSKSYSLI